MSHTITRARAHAIAPERLAAIRHAGQDEHGNPFEIHAAKGWEPLRCCLTVAAPGEGVALISYAPLERQSPWREVGPVFVHGAQCAGYDPDTGLPPQLRTGPRVLRTYDDNDALVYRHITLVPDGADIGPEIDRLLANPEVATVHVRALAAQCFTYAVTL